MEKTKKSAFEGPDDYI